MDASERLRVLYSCAVERKTSCGANPFCAPGSAPVFNPCGVAGGDAAEGSPGNGGDPPPGYKQGADGRELAELPGPKKIWKRGSHVNASWAVIANHGGEFFKWPVILQFALHPYMYELTMLLLRSGGYQYRLCRKIDGYEATEECFQKHPMEFAETYQYIDYCDSNNQYPPYNSNSGAFAPCSGHGHKIPAKDISVVSNLQHTLTCIPTTTSFPGTFLSDDSRLNGDEFSTDQ